MPYLIGVDEAGYGPNLGPLVVGATAWWVPEPIATEELDERLRRAVTRTKPDEDDPRLWIADSKELYSPAQGLGTLEHSVLAAVVAQRRHLILKWSDIWRELAPASAEKLDAAWYRDYDLALPTASDARKILAAAARLRGALAEHQLQLVETCARVVPAQEFNGLVDHHGNKGHVLSWVTVELIREVLERLPSRESTLVLCDRHGGRAKYQQFLQRQFPDHLVQVYQEGRQQSVYRMGTLPARTEIRFTVGGEAALPTALASMVAKYLRELAMKAFNAFWHEHDGQLKPCAGYPVDAKRFVQEIAPVKKRLKIRDETLWRQC